MKTCFKCGECLPVSSFYAHPKMADGLLGKCKSCTRVDVRENRNKKLDRYRAYDRERYHESGHRGTTSKEAGRRAEAKWLERNKGKRVAQVSVGNAIRDGRLIRPDVCERCGRECSPQAHHHDYDRPLDVTWLCTVCHGLEHRRYSREENRQVLREGKRDVPF